LLVKRFFFLLNAAFAMAILDLISQVHLPSSVNNNNNNNNIYLLQLGCHPVAVVILHVYKT